jgi:hypothetical protein
VAVAVEEEDRCAARIVDPSAAVQLVVTTLEIASPWLETAMMKKMQVASITSKRARKANSTTRRARERTQSD